MIRQIELIEVKFNKKYEKDKNKCIDNITLNTRPDQKLT